MISWILQLATPWLAFCAGQVHLAELRGTINPGSASYLIEALEKAETAEAALFVLKLDTPGGLLPSTREIIQRFSSSRVPVLVWVAPGGASATSAGALIALSAHAVALAPGTNIGAAHPVGGAGEDIKGTMGQKVTNDTAALARAQAALHGRNVEAAERIVTKSASFSPEEALRERIADLISSDLNEILKSLDGKAVRLGADGRALRLSFSPGAGDRLVIHEMDLRRKALHFISDPNVSALLLSLGGLALWAEVSSGFTSIVAGVVAAFCFILAFISLQTLPVNTGGLLLLGLGLVLLILEVYVTSFGLLAVAALVCLFLGGLFLIDPGSGSMQVSLSLLLSIVAGTGAVMISIGWLLARERHRVGLKNDPLLGAAARIQTLEPGALRGTAYVNGELWTFECPAPVAIGESHRVSSVKGMVLHLERGH